ncbi:hypothetical protein [Fusobacterium ulcerans]|uniref:Uncharacterized protein n=1 Tax=Fusobacterium ulcerans 12-1B TaxID=457404 RepID=H1PNV4_9FUSO|nr:hypothetical protein [Fusobacterium ulcerans]EHO85173.1 hypothetical protein HMPREF0402_00097 [Fusobacterium ulcerans 12-1B]
MENNTFYEIIGFIKNILNFTPLIGVILTFAISIAVYKFNKYKLYIDFITKERMEWVRNIRVDFSELYSSIYTFVSKDFISDEGCFKIYFYLTKLNLYFNPSDPKDMAIIEKLGTIKTKFTKITEYYKRHENTSEGLSDEEIIEGTRIVEEILAELDDLNTNIRKILKKGWEDVKEEVGQGT